MLVHPHEALQRSGERLRVSDADPGSIRNSQEVRGDLATTLMLQREKVGVRCDALHLPDDREDVLLFEFLLVIVLAERSEELSRSPQRGRIDGVGFRA